MPGRTAATTAAVTAGVSRSSHMSAGMLGSLTSSGAEPLALVLRPRLATLGAALAEPPAEGRLPPELAEDEAAGRSNRMSLGPTYGIVVGTAMGEDLRAAAAGLADDDDAPAEVSA